MNVVTMPVPASTASRTMRAVGILAVVAALGYLVPFVPRGWIPHDEGMLGQAAEQVLRGGTPHVTYEEPYTGGLTWIYAALFRVAGIDLLYVRWFLFAGAGLALTLVYAIARRYLSAPAAALGTWIALTWSFPNYFAALPSWWLLVCALACLWAVIRHEETGALRYAALAGLMAGLAVAVKQTGVYLCIALVLALVHAGGRPLLPPRVPRLVERTLGWAAAALAIAFGAAVLMTRLFAVDGMWLLVPAACCAAAAGVRRGSSPTDETSWRGLCVAVAATAIPVIVLTLPYVPDRQLMDLFNGAIVLPRTRLTFASAPMPGLRALLPGLGLLGMLALAAWLIPRWRAVRVALWVIAVVLPLAALRNDTAYQAIWQAARVVAAIAPIAAAAVAVFRRSLPAARRTIACMAGATAAWMSLNQFPFAAPIYFCYGAPLALLAAIAAGHDWAVARRLAAPCGVALVLFGVLSANRTYLGPLGVTHVPAALDTPLRLQRAHLRVSAGDAATYRYVVATVLAHLGRGPLVAGPDCPEVYFLTGQLSPSGTLFDFLRAGDNAPGRNRIAWDTATVVVFNHSPDFSPPLDEALLKRLRGEFPYADRSGAFEIRWR